MSISRKPDERGVPIHPGEFLREDFLTPLGLSGSIIQQINHGISTGALFLLVGVLYERRHTRLISEFGGLSTPMPNFAAIYLIISLSSLSPSSK